MPSDAQYSHLSLMVNPPPVLKRVERSDSVAPDSLVMPLDLPLDIRAAKQGEKKKNYVRVPKFHWYHLQRLQELLIRRT